MRSSQESCRSAVRCGILEPELAYPAPVRWTWSRLRGHTDIYSSPSRAEKRRQNGEFAISDAIR